MIDTNDLCAGMQATINPPVTGQNSEYLRCQDPCLLRLHNTTGTWINPTGLGASHIWVVNVLI